MRAHLLRFTIPLVAASVAQAQLPSLPQIRFDYNDETPWPTGVTVPNSFSRALAGDFDGNGLKDVVVLEQESAGGKVVYYPQPDSWPFQTIAWQTNGPLVNDVDVMPPSGSMPAQLALVGPNGLDRLLYAADGTYPVNGGRMGSYFAWAPIDHSTLWQGAKLVRTGQLDAGGSELDYVGVKDAVNGSTQLLESTVIVRQTIGTSTTTISFTLPGVVVKDAFIGQWNDTPDNEIFLLNTSGVEIYTPAGVRVRRFVRPFADDGADVFCGFKKNILVNGEEVPEGKLHVAWFRRNSVSAGTQELVELNAPAVTIGTGITFSHDDLVVSAIAGDSPLVKPEDSGYYPADGDQELAIRKKSGNSLTILANLGPKSSSAPVSFNIGSYQDVGTGLQGGPQLNLIGGMDVMAAPVYEDLGGDGLADIFLPVLHVNGPLSANVLAAIFDGDDRVPQSYMTALQIPVNPDVMLDYSEQNSSNTHSYAFTPGLDFAINLLEIAPPAGANAIEVFCWERNAATGVYAAMTNGHGYYNYTPPQTIDSNTRMALRLPMPSYPTPTGDPLSSSDWPTQYLFEIRFAQWSGSSLVPLGTNHIVMFGENVPATTNYVTIGFSDVECVGNIAATANASDYNCGAEVADGGGVGLGVQPVHSPVSFTRHRLPPRPNGDPALLPLPPERMAYQTGSNPVIYTYQL